MNILVTGGAGFIGSHVVDMLVERCHNVTVIDNFESRVHGTQSSRWDRLNVKDVRTIVADYWNTPYNVLRDAEVVIHLAAQVGVADSVADPARYIEHNSNGTAKFLHDLDHARRNTHKLQRIVVASSMSVYGDPLTGEPVHEGVRIAPTSPYGLSKYSQEQQVLLWGQAQGVECSALRYFNVYGPRQSLTNPYTGVLANFANWLLANTPPEIYEDGLQTRDFVHVSDVAAATVAVATGYDKPIPKVLNICTGQPTTILGAAQTLANYLEKPIDCTANGVARPGDIRHCIGDSHRISTLLPWHPVPFTKGLSEYAAYLLETHTTVGV